MKKTAIIIITIIIIVILYAYLKNDGLYILSNINASELELINKYTINFPKDTIIEEFKLENDIESYFFSHNQYMEATILVANDKIDALFPENLRVYNKKQILDLSDNKETDKEFWFGEWLPRTVVKWFDKTQRTVNFTVMQQDKQYTRVYVSVDKLGWNLYTK